MNYRLARFVQVTFWANWISAMLRFTSKRRNVFLFALLLCVFSYSRSQKDPREDTIRHLLEACTGLAQLRSAAQIYPEVRLALASAASDRAPELNLLEQSRDAGLITDWKVVGPFGKYALAEFDQSFAPERDQMRQMRYERRTVERVRFADGQFKLPEHYRKQGIFYAVGEVFLLNDGDWTVFLETPGLVEVRIDGESVLLRDDRQGTQPQTFRKTLRMLNGEHRVLVKFAASASPFRLAVMPPSGGLKRKNNIPLLRTTPEAEYVQAAIEYWNGDTAKVVQKTNALSIKSPSAVARLLLAETWDKSSGDVPEIRFERVCKRSAT